MNKNLLLSIVLFSIVGCATVPETPSVTVDANATVGMEHYSEGARMAVAFGLVSRAELDQIIADRAAVNEKLRAGVKKYQGTNHSAIGEGVRQTGLAVGLATLDPTMILISLPSGPRLNGGVVIPQNTLSDAWVIQPVSAEVLDRASFNNTYGKRYFQQTLAFLEESGIHVKRGVALIARTPFTWQDETGFHIAVEQGGDCMRLEGRGCTSIDFKNHIDLRFLKTDNGNYAIWRANYGMWPVAMNLQKHDDQMILWTGLTPGCQGYHFANAAKKIYLDEMRELAKCAILP